MSLFTLTVSLSALGLSVVQDEVALIVKNRFLVSDAYPPINDLYKIKALTNVSGIATFSLEPDDYSTFHTLTIYDTAGIQIHERIFSMPVGNINIEDTTTDKSAMVTAAASAAEALNSANEAKAARDVVVIKKYNTYASIMAGGESHSDGTRAEINGQYAAGDGGDRQMFWSSSSTATHNIATVIKPTGVTGAGRWLAVNPYHVNVRQFGAYGNDDDDDNDSDAFNACQDYCYANNCIMFIPVGTYRLNTLITYKAPIVGEFSNGTSGSVLKYYATDGTGCIYINGVNFWHIENIRILGGAGTLTQNAYGIRTNGSAYSNRFFTRNVYISKFLVGAYIRGYIADADLFIDYCGTAAQLDTLNASRIHLKIESCANGGYLLASEGVELKLLVEGTGAGMLTGFDIEGCIGVELEAPYFESAADGDGVYPTNLNHFLRIGNTSTCYNITINGGKTFGYDVIDRCIVFDRVVGLSVNNHYARCSARALGRIFRTTSNTKQIHNIDIYLDSVGYANDASLELRPVENLMFNYDFALGLKGFKKLGVINGGIATKETSLVRSGNGLKVASPAGKTTTVSAYINMPVDTLNYCKGRTVTLGAWVYVPAIDEYANLAALSPSITINDGVGSTQSAGGKVINVGQWSFITVTRAISAVATDITLIFAPLGYLTAYTSTGNEYIIVDSVFLVQGASIDQAKLINGKTQYLGKSGKNSGNKVFLPSDFPNDFLQSWDVGDVFLNQSVSASSPVSERVATTSGTSPTIRPQSWIIGKGATASRPTLSAADIGVTYLDTTLAANGKLITWQGTIWVDYNGTSV